MSPSVQGSPRVSVLLSSRNGGRFLTEALDSLAAQTYSDLEIVAVDDGSTDGTGEILSDFAQSRPSVRLLRSNGIGLAGALALAAGEARGTYLARQDDDDRSLPDRIGRQVAYLENHHDVAIVGTGATVIDEEGKAVGPYPIPTSREKIRLTLRRAVPFVHGSVLMRRSAYDAAGGYRAGFRASQDFDLWLRLPSGAGLANLPDPLYEWRLHPAGVFSRARADQLFYSAVARAFTEERRARGADSVELLGECPDPERLLARYPRAGRLSALLGEVYVREGLGREARRYLNRSLADPGERAKAIPWWLLSWVVPFTPRGRRAERRRAN